MPTVIALMLTGAFAEMVTIGAVLPFLTLLVESEEGSTFVFLRDGFTDLGFESRTDQVLAATLLFGAVALSAGALRFFLIVKTQRFIERVGIDLSRRLFTHVLSLPYSYHSSTHSSMILGGLEKTNTVLTGMLLPVANALTAFVLMIFLVAALISINPGAAIAMAVLGSAMYLGVRQVTRQRLRRAGAVRAEGMRARINIAQDAIGGVRDVIIDQTRDHFADRFDAIVKPTFHAQGTIGIISLAPRVVIEAFGMVLVAGLAYALAIGEGGVGAALPVVGAMALGAQRLMPLLQLVYVGWSAAAGSKQLALDILQLMEQPLPAEPAEAVTVRIPPPSEILFERVSFRYPSGNVTAVHNATFSARRGDRIGIIGQTGSGKSTLMDLLLGLLEPQEGRILIDGVPLDATIRRAWQRHVAHVPQAIYLSDNSVAENIAFGTNRHAIDRVRMIDAARKAELHDFIETLPEGYDTLVGERGVRLSGGQRQRIGIARALYKEASVIVFDEATAALDTETEAAVMRSIFDLRDDLIVFIIAHRLSTIEPCTKVLSLASGHITRTGSYAEVVEKARDSSEAATRSASGGA